jgi:hypothetical protein
MGRWRRDEEHSIGPLVRGREDLFDQVARAITDREVLYLESGVYKR